MPASNRTKQLAVMAVLAAFSTVLTVLGTMISVNTVFFTAMAAFLAGMILMRYGKAAGVLFFVVCAALDFLVNPDKFHVFLYVALAGYLVISELVFSLLRMEDARRKEQIHRGIRFLIFLLIYVPVMWFLPRMLVGKQFLEKNWIMPVLAAGGVVGWVIYDKAYCVFKRLFMERFSKML